MIKRELQRKIEDFREFGLPPYVPREGKLHLVDRVVSAVIGARRSGKSFRVLQVLQRQQAAPVRPTLQLSVVAHQQALHPQERL